MSPGTGRRRGLGSSGPGSGSGRGREVSGLKTEGVVGKGDGRRDWTTFPNLCRANVSSIIESYRLHPPPLPSSGTRTRGSLEGPLPARDPPIVPIPGVGSGPRATGMEVSGRSGRREDEDGVGLVRDHPLGYEGPLGTDLPRGVKRGPPV